MGEKEKKEERKKEEFEPFPFMKGETIDFTPGGQKLVELYCKWNNDPTVRRFSRNAMPRTVEEIKKWYEPPPDRGVRDFIVFTIWHKKDNKPIGICGLGHINWFTRWANAFLQIGEVEYWNKNIATEATKMLLKYAFEEVNLNKVSGTVAVENIGSWTVAEKCGFKFEGILEQEFYVDGRYIDVKKYSYLRENWFKQKEAASK